MAKGRTNGRASGKAKNGKARNGKANGAPRKQREKSVKPTAATGALVALVPTETERKRRLRDLKYQALGKILPLMEQKDEIAKEIKDLKEHYDEQGLAKPALNAAIKVKQKGEKETLEAVQLIVSTAQDLGMPWAQQPDLFASPSGVVLHTDWRELGREAAMMGLPCKVPEGCSSHSIQEWTTGWHGGQDALREQFEQRMKRPDPEPETEVVGDGFKPIGEAAADTVADLAEKAGIAASLNLPPPPAEHVPA